MGVRVVGETQIKLDDIVTKYNVRVKEDLLTIQTGEDEFDINHVTNDKESLVIFLKDKITGDIKIVTKDDFALSPNTITTTVTLNDPVTNENDVYLKFFEDIQTETINTNDLNDFTNEIPEQGNIPVYDSVLGAYSPKKIKFDSRTSSTNIIPDIIDGQIEILLNDEVTLEDKVILYKNDILIIEPDDYTVSGNVISLSEPLVVTDKITGIKLKNEEYIGSSLNVLDGVGDSVLTPNNYDVFTFIDTEWNSVSIENVIKQNITFSDLKNVNIDTPVNKDIIYYNGSNWIFENIYSFLENTEVKLDSLSNVSSKTVYDGDVLTFNINTNKWTPYPLNEIIQDKTPINSYELNDYDTNSRPTNNQIPYFDGLSNKWKPIDVTELLEDKSETSINDLNDVDDVKGNENDILVMKNGLWTAISLQDLLNILEINIGGTTTLLGYIYERIQTYVDGLTNIYYLNSSYYSVSGIVMVYLNGLHLNNDSYTLNDGSNTITLGEIPEQSVFENVYVILEHYKEIDTAAIELDIFTGDGILTDFNITTNFDVTNSKLKIFVDGLLQANASYSISDATNVLSFTEVIPNGNKIYVYHMKNADNTLMDYDEFISDGTYTQVILSNPNTSNSRLQVYIDGLLQNTSNYNKSIGSNIITFNQTIPNNTVISIFHMK